MRCRHPSLCDHFSRYETQKNLVGILRPLRRNQQRDLAIFDVKRTGKNPVGALVGDRHLHRLAIAPITTIQRRRFGENDFIQYEDYGAFARRQPLFNPPLACRQVGERKIQSSIAISTP